MISSVCKWCVTALFKAPLDVGGARKLPVCVCVCVCQMVGSGLQSGDVGILFHSIHVPKHKDREGPLNSPSFPSGRFLIYLYRSPSWCLSSSLSL